MHLTIKRNYAKRIWSIILITLMLFSSMPTKEFVGIVSSGFNLKASAATISALSNGDSLTFGWYPQSKVTDSALCSTLSSLAGSTDNWNSYGYYSGTGKQDGHMTPGNWMKYTDIYYQGNKYRGIFMTAYRPSVCCPTYTDSTSSYQASHGYKINVVYWFKFEPITWRVLDPSTGMIVCNTIIDAQPYNNYILSENVAEPNSSTTFWGDSSKTHYANNYELSSIRKWLNYDFYNTAFSPIQQDSINFTVVNNTVTTIKEGILRIDISAYSSENTTDKIYLLSQNDMNIGSPKTGKDLCKCANESSTDYAKSQGEQNCYTLLRTPGSSSRSESYCNRVGTVGGNNYVTDISSGIRPVLNLNLKVDIPQSDVSEIGKTRKDGRIEYNEKSFDVVSAVDFSQLKTTFNVYANNTKTGLVPLAGADIFLYLGSEIINKFSTDSNGTYQLDFLTATQNGKYDISNIYVGAEYQTDDYILYSENTTSPKIPLKSLIGVSVYDFVLNKYCKKYNISVAYTTGNLSKVQEYISEFRESFWQMTSGKCVIGSVQFNEYANEDDFGKKDDIWFKQYITTEADTNGFGKAGNHIYLSLTPKEQHEICGEVIAHEAGHYFFGFRDEYCFGKGYDYDVNGNKNIIISMYFDCIKKEYCEDAYIIFYTESSNIPEGAVKFTPNYCPGIDDKWCFIIPQLNDCTEAYNRNYNDVGEFIGNYCYGDLNQDGKVDGDYYYMYFTEYTEYKNCNPYGFFYNQCIYPFFHVVLSEKDLGYWSTNSHGSFEGLVKRPNGGASFGIMECDYSTTHLSTAEDYSYLKNINGIDYTIVDKNHPELYTRQYYDKGMSCSEMLDEILKGHMTDSKYSVVSHSASISSVYDANLYIPESVDTFVEVDDKENVTGNKEVYLSAIETTEKLVDISTNVIEDKIVLTVHSDNDQTYLFVESTNNSNIVDEINLNFTDGEATFELNYEVDNEYWITFVQKDENEQYIKNKYNISGFFSELSNESYYSEYADISANVTSTNGVSNDLLIIKGNNLYQNGEFSSIDGAIDIIKTDEDADVSGAITKSISFNSELNYETIGVFKYENGTYSRISRGYSKGEKQIAYIEFPYEGEGTYVVMAEPASDDTVFSITDLSVTESGECSGLYSVQFEDSNNNESELVGYYIYYSQKPIIDLNSENVYCLSILPSSKSTDINLKNKYGTWYFTVQTMNKSGAVSQLSETVQMIYNPLDSDDDGIPDYWIDKYYQDADLDNIAFADSDNDGLNNLDEYQYGTNPLNPDTDGDNVYDKVEIIKNLNPTKTTTDGITEDYIVCYGEPDVLIEPASLKVDNDAIHYNITNVGTGIAMHTEIDLYVDDILMDAWTVNLHSNATVDLAISLNCLQSTTKNVRIEIDKSRIIHDSDYSNNSYTITKTNELSFAQSEFYVTKKGELKLDVIMSPENSTTALLWKADGSDNITVGVDGTVKATGIGITKITVSDLFGHSAECTVFCVAFDGAEYSEFDSELINNGTAVEIIGYIGNEPEISVPTTIGGLPVIAISALGHTSIQCLNIPSTVTSISSGAFRKSTLLNMINVENENADFCSIDGILYDKNINTLICCPIAFEKNVIVPESVRGCRKLRKSICGSPFEL